MKKWWPLAGIVIASLLFSSWPELKRYRRIRAM